MRIGKIGEFGMIDWIKRRIKTDSSVVKGSGDDCAVLKFSKDTYQLFTCDMIVEGMDFTLKDEPFLIGRKAIAVSISDIASCAGIPRYCVVSAGIPKNINWEFLKRVFKGMLAIARKYKINLVGGDISRARQLCFDVSMLGTVLHDRLCLRSGAKTGDIIFVTGELGGSILGKHLRFTPRVEEAGFLARNFQVNSMIDISDGLVQDLNHILAQSKVGAVLYENLIPLSKKASGLKDALYAGEDFELIFTCPAKEAKKFLRNKLGKFKPIGEIVDKEYGLRLIDKKNREVILTVKGFRHF